MALTEPRGGSLARLFNPATVAIVGASDEASKYSGRIVDYCLRAGWRTACV